MNLWERYLSLSEEERDKVDEQEDELRGEENFFRSYTLVIMGRIVGKERRRWRKKEVPPSPRK
ncbi:MAG TPA: hypothetical protein VJB41_01345 [Patescibacteria group bacterium]|nr:hypothetical protein [Patescibacteria group bacterium]